MELYYLGRNLKGLDKYELVAICNRNTDVEQIETLAKTVGGLHTGCPSYMQGAHHSVEFESKHLREVIDFIANNMTENKKPEEEKYFAFLVSIPDDNNFFYNVYIALPKEIGDGVIDEMRPMKGFIYYEQDLDSKEDICMLSMKFSNPHIVMRCAERLAKFGIDVSNIRSILSGHFNTIQYNLQTMGGDE